MTPDAPAVCENPGVGLSAVNRSWLVNFSVNLRVESLNVPDLMRPFNEKFKPRPLLVPRALSGKMKTDEPTVTVTDCPEGMNPAPSGSIPAALKLSWPCERKLNFNVTGEA